MLKTSTEEFERILQQPEDIDLELKASTNQFDSSRGSLCDYCAAIANGRDGKGLPDLSQSEAYRAKRKTYTNKRLGSGTSQRIDT